MRHALRDAGFRNLVERDTVVVILVKAEDIRKVPGDCFAFAVGSVARYTVSASSAASFSSETSFSFPLMMAYFGLKSFFHVHAQARLRQIAHMAHGSDDFIVAAQIFLDRFRLAGDSTITSFDMVFYLLFCIYLNRTANVRVEESCIRCI